MKLCENLEAKLRARDEKAAKLAKALVAEVLAEPCPQPGARRATSARPLRWDAAVYLREIRIRNLKLLRDLRLSFTTSSGEPRMWTAIVGENGLCKTSILQAIALAASGPDRANQLADIPSLPDRRHPDEALEIAANFAFGPLPEGRSRMYPGWGGKPGQPPKFLQSRLSLTPGWKVFVGSSDYGDPSAHPQELLDPARSADPGPLREARAIGALVVRGRVRRQPAPAQAARRRAPGRSDVEPARLVVRRRPHPRHRVRRHPPGPRHRPGPLRRDVVRRPLPPLPPASARARAGTRAPRRGE